LRSAAARVALQPDGDRVDVVQMTGRVITPIGTLHDRLRPATTADIDHVVVAPTGVWVVDTKTYEGRVARRDVGGLLGSDLRLYVAGRDRTTLIPAVWKHVSAVRAALGREWADVPVRPMLCFVSSEWGWFPKPFELNGVVVAWPAAARQVLTRPGPYTAETVQSMAASVERRLRPAS
jgi:hypothetical protein